MGEEKDKMDPPIFHEELTVQRKNEKTWRWWTHCLQILWMSPRNRQPSVPMSKTTAISTTHSIHHWWSARQAWPMSVLPSEKSSYCLYLRRRSPLHYSSSINPWTQSITLKYKSKCEPARWLCSQSTPTNPQSIHPRNWVSIQRVPSTFNGTTTYWLG